MAPGPLRRVDQRWLRHINRALVLAALREHGPISRVGLAARTGLSRTTVGVIAAALLDEGLIREGERLPATGRGGRRAVLLHVVP
jgi:DNA-binding MarR family transcriptional regulator